MCSWGESRGASGVGVGSDQLRSPIFGGIVVGIRHRHLRPDLDPPNAKIREKLIPLPEFLRGQVMLLTDISIHVVKFGVIVLVEFDWG